jgi:uncharacterized OB-fold protein
MTDTAPPADAPGNSSPAAPLRILPELNERNRHFWQGGALGELVILRCQRCGFYLHPPQPICPIDQSKDLAPEPVSGRATVASFTIDHHPWLPAPAPPYVIALVELVEQRALRLTTNLVHCDFDDVVIGMPVRVVFEHHPDAHGDVWLPFFEPDGGGDGAA